MGENATHPTEHAIEGQDGPAATACDERDHSAQAQRTRQMALINGVMRDYEPALRKLAQR